ncbi:MAG: RNA-binding domain-containing protein [Akkermansiaceae bacterium]
MNTIPKITSISDIDLLRESVDLECKLALGQDGQGKLPKDFWPSYSAMANTDGGLILLGVQEKKGQFLAKGIPNPDNIRKELADLLGNGQKVSCNLLTDKQIQSLLIDDKTILIIQVPRANRKQRPVFINGNPLTGCYRRFHEADQEMPEDEVKLLLSEQQTESLDYQVLPQFGMQDISLPTLQAYRQTHATLNPNHPWSELENHTFLKEVRAWNYDRETNLEGLTVAGLLMFGKFQSIQDVFPHFALDYQERPDAKTEQRWIDRIWLDGSWSGNLYDFYRLVYPKLTAGLKVPFALKDGLRSEDTPIHEALREALANTLIHADYRHRARVLVVKRPDMYGFQNPGDMRIPLELALRGDEPDSRNKRLAHLFGFVHIGEKAGTGIPKILSGWKSQHWRQPSLTEEHQPSPRTILRLQMLDLFPPGVLDILKLQYRDRFDDLPQAHRLALAITFSERRLTHARLSELTELHPSDVTKTLRELINQQFLVSEGSGRGTIYRFKGSQKVTSDDVFCESSSPDLDASSPDLNASSPDLDTSSPDLNRSKDGLLISKYHSLNFVDDLDQLSLDKRTELKHLAQLPNDKAKIPRSEMVEVILNLCSGHYITLNALSKLVNRNPNGLRDSYITNLRKERQLKLAFPDKPNDERQAYTKA